VRKFHGQRKLLNLPGHESTAAIVAEVEDTSKWKKGCDRKGKPLEDKKAWWIEPEGRLVISYCSRSIELTISWETEEERENAVYKVDTLIKALQAFRDGLIVEQERYVVRKAQRPDDE